MNKLNIELTNCFGIDSLKHEFDFGKGNTFSIYARNGLMKTSFAKTFQLIQQGKKSFKVMKVESNMITLEEEL